MKKSECKNSDYKGEIISMVNAINDIPTLRKIWAFIRLLFLNRFQIVNKLFYGLPVFLIKRGKGLEDFFCGFILAF